MASDSNSPEGYIAALDPVRAAAIATLRSTINASLPAGFQESMGYGMIGWVVPHARYPKGYHCNPELPLPFLSIASQKHFVGFYHMGLYADPELLDWFQKAHAAAVPTKLDMGKSCVRFKRMDRIPFELIGDLVSRMSVVDWIARYEASFVR